MKDLSDPQLNRFVAIGKHLTEQHEMTDPITILQYLSDQLVLDDVHRADDIAFGDVKYRVLLASFIVIGEALNAQEEAKEKSKKNLS